MVEHRLLNSTPPLPLAHLKSTRRSRFCERRWRPSKVYNNRLGLHSLLVVCLFLTTAPLGAVAARIDGSPKIFKDLPASVSYFMNDGLMLTCSVLSDSSSAGTSLISWFKMTDKNQGEELNSGSNYIIHDNGRELEIVSVTSQQEQSKLKFIKGSYYCEAKNDHGTTRSRKCVVNPVSSTIMIGISPDISKTYEGGTAVLSCKIEPEYAHSYYRVVRWEIYDSNEERIMNITHTTQKYSIVRSIYPTELHIRQTRSADAKMKYKCVVQTTIQHRHPSRSNLLVSPFMRVELSAESSGYMPTYMRKSHHLMNIKAMKGTTVEIPCVVHSSPGKVKYEWKYGNETIYPLDSRRQAMWGRKYKIVDVGGGNLQITNLEKKDSGRYSCVVSWMLGDSANRKASTVNLKVQADLGVTLTPSSLEVDYKHKAVLNCTVHGYPFLRSYWLFNGKSLTPSENVVIHDDRRSSSRVEIKAVDRLNAGVYQCFFEQGQAIEPSDNAQAYAVLRVRKVPPELVTQFPLKVAGKDYAYTVVNTGSSKEFPKIVLHCAFVGNPAPRITWFLDDTRIPITNAGFSTVYPWKDLTIDLNKAFKSSGVADVWAFSGEYRARAQNDYGQAECRTFVEIDTKLTIRQFTKKKKPIEGRDFELKCYVLGRNSVNGVTIEWTKEKDGKKNSLPNNHRHSVKEEGRTLVIKNVKKDEDDGKYKCIARDKDGNQADREVTLDVMRMPVINDFVDKYHLDEGQDKVTVTCNIKNQADEPWYAWWQFKSSLTRRDKILKDSSSLTGVRITYAQTKTGSRRRDPIVHSVPKFVAPNTWVMLEIERPKKILHAGNYTCIISNKVGSSNQTAQVTFRPKIKFDVQPEAARDVVLNKSLVIHCSAKGEKPKPTVEWKYFDNAKSRYAPVSALKKMSKGRIYQDKFGTLRVINVSKTDPIQFMCYISLNSTDAEVVSQVVKVRILYPAEIRPMKDKECKQNAELNLTCYIEGDDPVSSRWEYFDKMSGLWHEVPTCDSWATSSCRRFDSAFGPIYKSETHVKNGRDKINRLRFPNIQQHHQMRYRCSASNKYNTGEVQREVKVTVISFPGQPQDLKAKEEKARSVVLVWRRPEKDGNKPITHYSISIKRSLLSFMGSRSNINVSVHEGPDYRQKIKNLRPAALYRFAVVAVNAVGRGKEATIDYHAEEAKPEAPVQNLTANGTGSDTIRISWLSPPRDKLNGMLTSYSVCILRASAGSTDNEKIPTAEAEWSRKKRQNPARCMTISPATENHKVFSDLPKFTKYYIRVIAHNQKGPSPSAFTYARTLEDVPRRPPIGVTCTAGQRSVKLQWNPPKQGDMNGILTGYTIRYFETNVYEDESSAKVINISSNTYAEVHNLEHYTNYTFRIYAVNSKGSGPPSDPARCETHPSSPKPPAEVKFLPVNGSCLVASWRHPEESNGRLTEYVLYFLEVGSSAARPQSTVVANTSLYFNTKYYCDLKTMEYKIAIKAKNHAGLESSASLWKTAAPNSRAPAKFIGFSRSVVTNNRMNLDLSCEAVGVDPLHVKLTKTPSDKISRNQIASSLQRDHFLHLKDVKADHRGIYECSASNEYGEDHINYNVDVQAVPVKPKLIHGRQRLHSVEVEWRPLGSTKQGRTDTPISRYWLQYSNKYTGKVKTVSVSANNRTFFLSNLTCGTVIDFQIWAENRVGNSTMSEVVRMRTRGSNPVPSGLNNIVQSGQAYFNLTAAFRPGEGCPPLKYRIILVPVELPSDNSFSDPSSYRIDKTILYENLENQCCVNISDLHRGSSYRYLIEATNAAGVENQTGRLSTPSERKGPGPTIRTLRPHVNLPLWQRPVIVVTMVLTIIVVLCVGMAIILFLKRRHTAEEMREQQKGPVKKCVNDLSEGKKMEGLPHFGSPFNAPNTEIRPGHGDDDERLSNDGSIDSEGNINPYATFATYETATIDRHEQPDDGPRELGPVAVESGRMAQRIRPITQKRKRPPHYEPHGPKPYENDSVSGTLASKRRSNSLDRLDELDPAAATYNRGYATGGGGQMGRSCYEPKYPSDHMSHYRGGSVMSSTTMSSNHDELSQAYEYGRRARYECALNTADGFNVDENLDLHTGSGSSETTDPGIRQFTQQPPMPDEQRQATCEVPLFNKTPTTDRRRPSYASETYEPMDESYYRRNHLPRPIQHPARQAPLPDPPGAQRASTLGRHPVGATAASTRAAMGGLPFRSRADSDSTYGGHVYDSTDTYYSGANYGRRGPMPHAGPSGVEYPRHPTRVPASRYYNGGGGGGPSERHPLVPGGPGPGGAASIVRPLPYGAHGGDPDEAQSLLVARRYSVQRGASSGSGGSGGSGGAAAAAAVAAAMPPGSRRPSRPTAPVGGDAAGPAGLLVPVPVDHDDDSETENIYTSEFTVV